MFERNFKKIILGAFLLTATIFSINSLSADAQALRILRGTEGGTGYGTTTSSEIGNCLKVATSTPFLVWTIGSCGASGAATTTINGAVGPAFTFATSTGTGFSIATSTGTVTFNYPTLPLSLLNGGEGIPNTPTLVSTTGTINNQAVASTKLIFTGNTNTTINGFAAQTNGTVISVTNALSAGTLSITHQNTGSTASNRTITAGAVTMVISNGTTVQLIYDGNTSRWRVFSGYAAAAAGNDGYLTAANFTTFNAKPGGSGAAGQVATWFSSNTLTGTNNFSFDPTPARVGIQVAGGASNEDSVLEVDNTIGDTLASLSSFSATLTLFTDLSTPAGYTTTQTAGHLYAPTSFSGSSSAGGSSYSSGDSIDYRITAYNNSSGTIYSVVNSTTNVSITSNNDNVSLSWADNTTGTAGISGYVIERQVNGGGYNTYADVGATTNVTDDSSAIGGVSWSGSPFSASPLYPDFIANGSTRNYKGYAKDSIEGVTFFSPGSFDPVFTDDSSGNPYVIAHSISGSSARSLSDGFATAVFDTFYDGTSFTEDSTTFTLGSTVTPTTYGTISDGSFWNQDYNAYNFIDVPLLYSSVALSSSTVDPNDGQYHYITFTFTGASSGAKIFKAGAATETKTSSPFYYEGSGGFAGDTVVSPTAIYPPTAIFHQAPTEEAIRIVASTGEERTDIRLYNNVETLVLGGWKQSQGGDMYLYQGATPGITSTGFLKFNSSETVLNGNGSLVFSNVGTTKFQITATQNVMSQQLTLADGVNVAIGTTNGTKYGLSTSAKQGWFNATPIVQPGATTEIGVALSNLGFRAAGTAYPITTSGAITLGSLTAGRIPYAGTAGLLSDTANFVWTNASNRLGIGTTTPVSTLSVKGTAGSNLFLVASSTNAKLYEFDVKGHTYYGGTGTTSVSSCGTSPSIIRGNDTVGRVQVGSVVATSCQIDFSYPWDYPPACDGNVEGGITTGIAASSTVSSVVFTGASALTGNIFTYQCFGIR